MQSLNCSWNSCNKLCKTQRQSSSLTTVICYAVNKRGFSISLGLCYENTSKFIKVTAWCCDVKRAMTYNIAKLYSKWYQKLERIYPESAVLNEDYFHTPLCMAVCVRRNRGRGAPRSEQDRVLLCGHFRDGHCRTNHWRTFRGRDYFKTLRQANTRFKNSQSNFIQ